MARPAEVVVVVPARMQRIPILCAIMTSPTRGYEDYGLIHWRTHHSDLQQFEESRTIRGL